MTYDTVPGRCAVRIVNGFDRRSTFGEFLVVEAREYPWIRLCLDWLPQHSGGTDIRVLGIMSWLEDRA